MPRHSGGLTLKARRPRTPTGPSGPISVTNTNYQIDLAWADADLGDSFSGWQVERAQAETGPWVILATGLPATPRTYVDTGLAYGATAWYRVGAVQTAGNVTPYTSAVSATRTGNTQVALGSDAFSGTAGQTVQTHDSNWQKVTGSQDDARLAGDGRVIGANISGGTLRIYRFAAANPAIASYVCGARVYRYTNDQAVAGPVLNMNPTATARSGYELVVDNWSDGAFYLHRWQNGSKTQLFGPYQASPISAGTSAKLWLQRAGNTLIAKRGDTFTSAATLFSVTDPNPLPDIGKPGFHLHGMTGGGIGLAIASWEAFVPGASSDVTAPAQPILALATGTGAVTLTITHADDGVSTARILRSRTAGGPYTRVRDVTASASPMTSSDSISVYNVTYYYRVSMLDAAGNESPLSAEQSIFISNTASPDRPTLTGSMTFWPNFNTIGVDVPFTGDDNMSMLPILEYSEDGVNWNLGIADGEAWPTYDDVYGRRVLGSIVNLTHDTRYYIRCTLTDADGVNGEPSIVGQVNTRPDNYPDLYDAVTRQLKATVRATITHWVNAATGNDGNLGTSAGAAWATLSHAWTAAPSGAILYVAPGSYAPPRGTARTTPLTVVTEYAAHDGNGGLTPGGQYARVEPEVYAAPTTGVWTQVPLGPGPRLGNTYTLWKWTGALTGAPFVFSTLNVASNLTERPYRVNRWRRNKPISTGTRDGFEMDTPAGWAEVLYNNTRWSYGCAEFGADLYVRLPGDKNPNNYHCWCSGTTDSNDRMRIVAPDVRISGLMLRTFRIEFQAPASNTVIDNCVTYNVGHHGYTDTVTKNIYVNNVLFENNLAEMSGFWSYDPVWPSMPWRIIKNGVQPISPTYPNGTPGGWDDVCKYEETDGSLFIGNGGFRGLVVRNNYIRGVFNGVTEYWSNNDIYAMGDCDIHDNAWTEVGDDIVEPESFSTNWRVWNNTCLGIISFISTAPLSFGPVYAWHNTVVRVGPAGMTPDNVGSIGAGGKFVKFSNYSSLIKPARIYLINNTLWSDLTGESVGDGLGNSGGGSGNYGQPFWMRNNIIRSSRYIMNGTSVTHGPREWNEDYNQMATSDPSGSRGLGSRVTMTSYRTASGQGTHSNPVGDLLDEAALDSQLTDPANGDVTLVAGSGLIDAGIAVAQVTSGLLGAQPDIGGKEKA